MELIGNNELTFPRENIGGEKTLQISTWIDIVTQNSSKKKTEAVSCFLKQTTGHHLWPSGFSKSFIKKIFPNALHCAPMQENVQTSLHVDWAVWVKTDWARRGGRKRRQKKATKHHKCGTPIMNLLISYFGVGILKFVGQHLDTQGLSAEPSMKNRINSNSTAWYWKVRVQEDFQKMAHVYLMSSAFLLIPFWQIFWFHLTLDRDGSVGQWWQFADEWFPVPHFLLTSACQQFDFHEEFKSSNCVKQFRHTGSAGAESPSWRQRSERLVLKDDYELYDEVPFVAQ